MKNQVKETAETWNKVAKLYEEGFMDLDLYNDSYDLFCDLIKVKNPNVLEIGCGPGNIAKYLLSRRPDFEIHGIDYVPNMITLAQKNNPSAVFTQMNSADISKFNQQFNAIISGFSCPYISKEELTKMIKDSSDLLLDDGIMYLSFVEGDYEDSTYISGSTGDRMFFYYHSLENLEKDFVKYGFKRLELIYKFYQKRDGVKEKHTIIIFQKIAR